MQDRTLSKTQKLIQAALQARHGLSLLHTVIEDSVGQAVISLLAELVASESNSIAIAKAYSQAFRELALAVNREGAAFLPDAWQVHLLTRLINDTNAWSVQAERYGPSGVSATLHRQAQRELQLLQLLFNLNAETLWRLTLDSVSPELPTLQDTWLPWLDIVPSVGTESSRAGTDLSSPLADLSRSHIDLSSPVTDVLHLLLNIVQASDNWENLAEILEAHWARHGTGVLAHYRFLRWQGIEAGLAAVEYPDTIQLNALVEYEQEKAQLKANTERFLRGLPAHDVLLYGAPGTGKSSTVKALVNTYAHEGLRLVEVRKEQAGDLLTIVTLLRQRAPRYIIFIDDLSFEEQETQYKVLKVLLEGTTEARPANVLIYATTNRWNLIRENFSDRGKQSEDVHWRDTMEEKQSLVHRFGLRITFTTPDQDLYLTIVEGLMAQRGLNLPREELRERALRWERQHVGRSGRVARQFVDELEAELKTKRD